MELLCTLKVLFFVGGSVREVCVMLTSANILGPPPRHTDDFHSPARKDLRIVRATVNHVPVPYPVEIITMISVASSQLTALRSLGSEPNGFLRLGLPYV